MESSFTARRHEHTCADCLHWAETPHADAFLRSRWARQIRILVFTLDFSLPKCVHLCLSAGIKAEGIFFTENFRSFSYITVLTPQSDCWVGGDWGVSCASHIHFLLLKLMPPRSSAQQAESPPPLRQSKFTTKWNLLYANKHADEIKHSGELSGLFRNQYKAFHLCLNLFLVIILHILSPVLCLFTHKLFY